MSRPKRDPSADKDKKRFAKEWKSFRKKNKLSQVLLAEIIHVSRRTIQSIEASGIIPQKGTLDKFEELRDKYAAEGRSTGLRKKKETEQQA